MLQSTAPKGHVLSSTPLSGNYLDNSQHNPFPTSDVAEFNVTFWQFRSACRLFKLYQHEGAGAPNTVAYKGDSAKQRADGIMM
eukprot:4586220-Amphidinium_carterae.1